MCDRLLTQPGRGSNGQIAVGSWNRRSRHHLYAFRSEHIHALSVRLIAGDHDAIACMGRRVEHSGSIRMLPAAHNGIPRIGKFARLVNLQHWSNR
jgi:hypothetical protein